MVVVMVVAAPTEAGRPLRAELGRHRLQVRAEVVEEWLERGHARADDGELDFDEAAVEEILLFSGRIGPWQGLLREACSRGLENPPPKGRVELLPGRIKRGPLTVLPTVGDDVGDAHDAGDARPARKVSAGSATAVLLEGCYMCLSPHTLRQG